MTFTEAVNRAKRGATIGRLDLVLVFRRGTDEHPRAMLWLTLPDTEPTPYEPTDEDRRARDWRVLP